MLQVHLLQMLTVSLHYQRTTSGIARRVYIQQCQTTQASNNLQFDGTNLTVGGDITCSDLIRLKTNLEQIEGAVSKV